MHGPEHHVLDDAAVLTAYRNAGGDIDLPAALAELMSRGLQMPGAMCGRWGVCGATASVSAALSILEATGPLTSDDSWGSHMVYTSRARGAFAHWRTAMLQARCVHLAGDRRRLHSRALWRAPRKGRHLLRVPPAECSVSGRAMPILP
jgi:hypothetical protein